MKKTLTSGLLAISLAFGGLTPAPVLADRDDRTRLLLGLAALAAVGIAVHNRNERRDDERQRERTTLPRECLIPFDTREGRVALFEQNCLSDRFSHIDRLPMECATTIRSGGYFYNGFAPQCLHDAGYRVSDR